MFFNKENTDSLNIKKSFFTYPLKTVSLVVVAVFIFTSANVYGQNYFLDNSNNAQDLDGHPFVSILDYYIKSDSLVSDLPEKYFESLDNVSGEIFELVKLSESASNNFASAHVSVFSNLDDKALSLVGNVAYAYQVQNKFINSQLEKTLELTRKVSGFVANVSEIEISIPKIEKLEFVFLDENIVNIKKRYSEIKNTLSGFPSYLSDTGSNLSSSYLAIIPYTQKQVSVIGGASNKFANQIKYFSLSFAEGAKNKTQNSFKNSSDFLASGVSSVSSSLGNQANNLTAQAGGFLDSSKQTSIKVWNKIYCPVNGFFGGNACGDSGDSSDVEKNTQIVIDVDSNNVKAEQGESDDENSSQEILVTREIVRVETPVYRGITLDQLDARLKTFEQNLDLSGENRIVVKRGGGSTIDLDNIYDDFNDSADDSAEKAVTGGEYSFNGIDGVFSGDVNANNLFLSGNIGSTSTTTSTFGGSVQAISFIGDGSQLTGISAGATSTDGLTEGSTNLYYNQSRFDSAFSAKNTGDLSEGSNLYFTDARAQTSARNAFSNTATGLIYATSTGILSLTTGYEIPTTASTTDWDNKVSSQWGASGSDIYYDGGNVGIGTTSPSSRLQVSGGTGTSDTDFIGAFVQNGVTLEGSALSNSSKTLTVQGDGAAYITGRDVTNDIEFIMGTSNTGNTFAGSYTNHGFQLRTNNQTRMTINTTGNIGIGTTNPAANLDVSGTGRFTGNLTANSFTKSGGTSSQFLKADGSVDSSTYITNLSSFSTTDLGEGTNLYYTQSRFDSAFSAKDTGGLSEGSNLYFTNTRARNSISNTTTGLTYTSGTGILSLASGYEIPTTASTTDWNNKVSSQWGITGSDVYYNGGNVGIGTATPTEALTLAQNKNIELFGTSDQTTTWKSLQISHDGSTALIKSTARGTIGSSLKLESQWSETNPGSSYLEISRLNQPRFTFYTNPTSTPGNFTKFDFSSIASSGEANFFDLSPTVNQSGTAGFRAMRISPYIGTTGSGVDYLLDVGTNSATGGAGTHTSDFVIDSDGNVGIGTDDPTAPLHVEGSTNPNIKVVGTGNTSAYLDVLTEGTGSAIQRFSTANSPKWSAGVDGTSLDFIISNTFNLSSPVMVLDRSNGNVGIGTDDPLALLDVDGSAVFNKSEGDNDFSVIGSSIYNYPIIYVDASSYRTYISKTDDATTYGNSSLIVGGNIQAISSKPSLILQGIDDNGGGGNVWQLMKALQTDDTDGETINVAEIGVLAGGIPNTGFMYLGARSDISYIRNAMRITDENTVELNVSETTSAVAEDTWLQVFGETSKFGAKDYFALTSSYASGNANQGDVFIVDSSGNVGIGTTAPDGLLDVNNSGTATNQVNGAVYYQDSIAVTTDNNRIDAVQFQNLNTGNLAEMRFITAADDDSYMAFTQPSSGNTGSFFGLTKSTGSFIFSNSRDVAIGALGATKSTYIGAGGSVRMKIASNGNVGIGTTNPQQLLHIVRSTDGAPIRVEDSNGYCEIDPTSTTWTCTSDRRLKDNIESLDNTSVYEKLTQLNPVTFQWKTDSSNKDRLGLIAQEVEDIFPDLVNTNEDGYKSVAYGGFTTYLISAVIELGEKVDAIQAQLAAGVSGSIAGIKNAIFETLTIGSEEKPSGITLYDEVTGEAYCLIISDGEMINREGECGSVVDDEDEEDEESNSGSSNGGGSGGGSSSDDDEEEQGDDENVDEGSVATSTGDGADEEDTSTSTDSTGDDLDNEDEENVTTSNDEEVGNEDDTEVTTPTDDELDNDEDLVEEEEEVIEEDVAEEVEDEVTEPTE